MNSKPYFYTGALHTALKTKVNKAQSDEIHRRMDHYIAEYKKAKGEVDEISVACSFNDLIQKNVDDELNSELGKTVSCRNGCNHCCHQIVMVTDDEAKTLIQYSSEQNILINWDRINLQKDKKDEHEYSDLNHETRGCVFLDKNGSCGVYEHRPSSCRKLHVIGDPIQCDTRTNPKGQVTWFISLEAEIISSATFNATENGNMAAMLTKYKEWRQS